MRLVLAISVGALAMSACSKGADNATQQASPAPANAAVAAAAASPLGKAVSGARAKKVMHDRHEGMEDIGDAMKLVGGELRKDSPDLAKVRSGAATFARYAPQVKGWYPPGSGPEAGKTRAKAAIWQKPADFRAKSIAFERAATKFNAAAKSGDLAAIRAASGDLGKSCKACHDPYREPEHD